MQALTQLQDETRKSFFGKNRRKGGVGLGYVLPVPPTSSLSLPGYPGPILYKQQNVISNVRTQHGSRDKIA